MIYLIGKILLILIIAYTVFTTIAIAWLMFREWYDQEFKL